MYLERLYADDGDIMELLQVPKMKLAKDHWNSSPETTTIKMYNEIRGVSRSLYTNIK